MTVAVLLVAHGTVDDLDDLPELVRAIRRGHAAPPETIAELRRHYEAIGGSPLNDITRRLAAKVETKLGVPTRMAMRLFRPYVKDVVMDLGADEVVLVPLAQYSAHVYAAAAHTELAPLGTKIHAAGNWGSNTALVSAWAQRVASEKDDAVILTAHSLPTAVAAKDPYEALVRESANALLERLPSVWNALAFQSQGEGEWLGPTVRDVLDRAKADGKRRALFVPIGFLADHVEVLYDLDIEARALANDRGLEYARAPMLNDSDDLADIVASIARELL